MTTHRLRFVIVLLSLLGAGVLVAVFIHVRDKRALRAYKAGLLANGEKLTIEELVAASSAEANFAANHLLQAAWMLNQNGPVMPMNQPPAMRFVAPGKAMVGWKQPDIRVEGSRTNRWEELAAQLRDNSETLTQIREELKDGQLDWRLNYRQGFNILLPHLAKMKQIGQWLSAASMNNLHNGNIESAQADLQSLLSLANGFRDERLLISQLIRIALAAIAIGDTWEALQADGWTDARLAELQKRWESLDFVGPMEKSIEMERAMGIDVFARLRVSAAERKQFFDALAAFGTPAPPPPATPTGLKDMPLFIMGLIEEGIDSAGPPGREHLWCWFWSYEDERRCLQADQATLDRLRQAANRRAFDPMPAASDEASFGFALEPIRARKQRYLVSASRGDSLEHCLLKVARIETRRTLVVTAIALKRYELRREKPAPDLNALVPGILARLPVDWMDGRPLRYRLKADGHFLLYSVNEDGRDDGGDPTSPEGKSAWDNGRDLVWPTPATGSEIAQAQEKEANANPRPRSGRVAAP